MTEKVQRHLGQLEGNLGSLSAELLEVLYKKGLFNLQWKFLYEMSCQLQEIIERMKLLNNENETLGQQRQLVYVMNPYKGMAYLDPRQSNMGYYERV